MSNEMAGEGRAPYEFALNDDEDDFTLEAEEGPYAGEDEPLRRVDGPLGGDAQEGGPLGGGGCGKRSRGQYAHLFRTVLGWRFCVFLLFSQLVGKGMLGALARRAMLPLFKTALQVDPLTMQLCAMLVMLPWSVKPLLGLLSDFVLLGGYRKRYWLVAGGALGACGATALLIAPLSVGASVAGLLALQLQVALYDLLTEGKYSEVRNAHPEVGSSITTLVHGMQTVGALITIAYVGALADGAHYVVIFALCLGMSLSMLPATLMGWLPEERHPQPLPEGHPPEGRSPGRDSPRVRPPEGRARCLEWADPERMARERRAILVVALCGAASIGCSAVAAFASPVAALGLALGLLALILAGCWAVFPRRMTDVALYLVLTSLGAPAIGTALDYFYTATPQCLADGPHFSYTYYITWAGAVGTAVSLAGILLYEALLSRMRFRPVLMVTTLLGAVGGLGDLIIVLRWNVRAGVSDHVAYMVGQAVVEPLVGTLRWIPASALIVMAAPQGMEASAFAFIAGLSNFAGMVSELCGVVLFTAAGIEPCNFDSLWWLIVACHMCIPLCVGAAAVWLVPNVLQTEA